MFASQYTKVLPVEMAGQYLQATVQVLEASDANVPIKISAVKAVLKYGVALHLPWHKAHQACATASARTSATASSSPLRPG